MALGEVMDHSDGHVRAVSLSILVSLAQGGTSRRGRSISSAAWTLSHSCLWLAHTPDCSLASVCISPQASLHHPPARLPQTAACASVSRQCIHALAEMYGAVRFLLLRCGVAVMQSLLV